MKLCPDCLGRGFVYSPGGYAPKLDCPTCQAPSPDSVDALSAIVANRWLGEARPATRAATLSGASYDLQAFHVDPIMDEGEHVHTWTITAWWPSEPWRDGRALGHALRTVVEGLAPYGAGNMREYRQLPAELWSGEAIAAAVLALLSPPPVRVNVDRPGFHVERWA